MRSAHDAMQHTCYAAQPITHTLHTIRLYKQPHLAQPAVCCSSPTGGAHGAGASRIRFFTKMSALSALSSKIATVLSWLHALLEPVLALRELRACATAVDHLGVGIVENCSQGVSERPARQLTLHKLTRGAVRVTVGENAYCSNMSRAVTRATSLYQLSVK